uniref:Mitotic spindle assembly checkpoint protein MAD1 n=1 Tax=Physcomitrium patens TaxID=3218 RepID=A0A7I4B8J6_PHYPA|nr:mitotic spindle checkpoint protein MAD1-like isoform X2 [Physcomitrium patens]|eukprot:XP_024401614.1 mitotic spindle checkpoint protein MAD1-like isoform X2 [Physcomitrella patens]
MSGVCLLEPGSPAMDQLQRPSPTKRPRAPPDHVDDDDFLSRRALEVYNGAQRSGSHRMIAFTTRPETDLGPGEFDDLVEHFGPGSSYTLDCDDHDHLNDSSRCTYKCRSMVKSEVLENLEKREKQVFDLQSSVDSLRSKLSLTEDSEKRLVQSKKSLEQVVAASSGREASMHAQRLQESAKSDEMLRTQLKRCHELQARLQEEMQLKAEAEAKALAAEARALEAEQEKLINKENSTREINQLSRELARLRRDSDYSLKRLRVENETQMEQTQLVAEEIDTLMTQLDEEKKLLAQTVEEKQELEHKLADAMKQLATRTTTGSEADTVIKHLQDELNKSSADVAEARKLKQMHVNVALLKEQLHSEQLRANRAEAGLTDLVNLQSRVNVLESELERWSDMIEVIPGAQTRDDVPRCIAELQRAAVAATAKTGDATSQISELKIAVERAERSKLLAEARASTLQEEVADAMMNAARLERKIAMLSSERDGLKRILESYDSEEAVIASHRKPGDKIANLSTPEKSKDNRIQELSSALNDAQQNITQLDDALSQSNNTAAEQRQKIESLTEELNDAIEKINSLNREGERLRKEVAGLELKLGRGEFNRATTKVLHLVKNLESGGSSTKSTVVTRETNKTQSEELAALTKQIASLEKREARYRQIFADKISLFREACYLLFGYKVQMHEEKDSLTLMPVTVFTLQSIYAASDEDKLLFQLNQGRMDMLATDFTTSPEISRQVTTFLKNFKSIPAFMANLTMELFNRTTLS